MGLTIHYSLSAKFTAPNDAVATVERIRELAMDLPFESVGELLDLSGAACDGVAHREKRRRGEPYNEELAWLLCRSVESVTCPWNKRLSRDVSPLRVIAFAAVPGPGSEWATIGLCQYPAGIDWPYDVREDWRFQTKSERSGWHEFDWLKWRRFCNREKLPLSASVLDTEPRRVPTKLAGWSWSAFCKTQYASNADCGGVANFLRCHISVITLLERAAKIPGLRVHIDDEGHYGPATYSDDYREAGAAGRKPTYVRHKGQYNPKALAAEVGDWNEMIAGFSGALSDALAGSGVALQAPIKGFPDFEHLEFKGKNKKLVDAFLTAMHKRVPGPPGEVIS